MSSDSTRILTSVQSRGALPMLRAYVRAYPGRSAAAIVAVLVAGLMDGLGLSMLLSMLSLATRKPDQQPSLPEQVATFLSDLGGSAPASALYVVEIGGNDLRDALVAGLSGGAPAAQAVIQAALESVSDNLVQLYIAGARDFLIWSAPDIGLAPAINGNPLECNGADGWRLKDSFTIELLGATCEMFKKTASAMLIGNFPCDVVVE
jgi:hypothetical protein